MRQFRLYDQKPTLWARNCRANTTCARSNIEPQAIGCVYWIANDFYVLFA